MRKIFITGICGFVGSNLANFYIEKNYKIVGIDNLSRKGSYKNFLKLKKKGIKIFKGNLCDDNLIKKILSKKNKFDDLIHCAAYTSVLDGTNKISEKQLYKNNILSTLNSLELAKNFKSNYIYISSSRIYNVEILNNLKFKFHKKYKPIKNNLLGLGTTGIKENFSTMTPISIYGSSKIISENMIQEYCGLNHMHFIINRCGLLAGSGQLYKNDQGIISFWINSWKKNKKLYYIGFNGLGYQTRDCLHPFDLGTLINLQIKKIKSLKISNRIYNVSGGINSAFSLKELSNWCCNNIGLKKIKSSKKSRKFDVKWLVLDNSKAKKQFNWKIKYNKHQIFKNILNEND
tara:strand:- start:1840 stop:2877 length:1038 start_codon:yes stop_codon:yes gene_type:complete